MKKMNDFNFLLERVIDQAEKINIPVSHNISPDVIVNKRAVRRLGCCKKDKNGRFTIELSADLIDAPEKSCMQTLAHEVIHTCPKCFDHGEKFKKYAALMNSTYGYDISRTASREEMGIEIKTPCRYIIKCEKCGAKTERVKRSPLVDNPARYRCRCGGKLVRIK